ncbi:hypothetical protein MF672_042110 [Actinomadura sp. ATCC 31491]|uniref:DUF4383 domain-containing protein n=1 Tax=Actinomadura luzonensis TaxID=2805427 RepID=A0ABT0G7I8_9ACTN|nr:hypothetical protein [Actinomadura luzonensis]MCK2220353.1 hypothetical protein [Actinomadura luzonensis]
MSVPAPAPAAGRALRVALPAGVALLLAMDLTGAALSVSAGLNHDFLDALGPQARLSAPIPMMAAQVVLVAAASARRRALAVPAAALLVVAGVLAFVSGFYDGGYAVDLTAGQRVFQIALVSAHLALSGLAAARLVRLLRRRGEEGQPHLPLSQER